MGRRLDAQREAREPPRRARFIKLTLGGALTLAYLWHVSAYDFLNDDAFISMRYALHWAQEGEVVYNLGERVEGYTNFLWVALLALVGRLGGELPLAARLLGPLFGLLSLSAVWWLAQRLDSQRLDSQRLDSQRLDSQRLDSQRLDSQRLDSQRLDSQRLSLPGSALSLWAPLLLCVSPSFVCWSSGGLEVQLFTSLSLWGLALSLEGWGELGVPRAPVVGSLEADAPKADAPKADAPKADAPEADAPEADAPNSAPSEAQSTPHPPCRWALSLGGVSLALACMSRPEGLLLVGLVGLWGLSRLFKRAPHALSSLTLWSLSWALLYVPYFIWRWRYYGYPLPNTYYVKTGADGFWGPGGRYLLEWALMNPWSLLSLVPVWGALKARAVSAFGVIAGLWCVGLSVHVAKVGGDFMALHRFLVPITPLIALGAAPTLLKLLTTLTALTSRLMAGRFASSERLAQLLPTLALLLALSVSAQRAHQHAMRVGSEAGVDSIGWLKQFVGQCEQLGRWVALNTPPEARLATTAAGALPYYAQRHTLDLLGLNDEWVAHNVPARGHRPGHTKAAPLSYVLQQDIDLLIYHPVMSARPPRAHPSYARLLEPRGYKWRVVEPPQLNPRYWGLWVKRGFTLSPPPAPLSPSQKLNAQPDPL